MSMALRRNANLLHEKHQKMDAKILVFSRFTTVTAHFHRMVFVEPEKWHCFVRRCVSMRQSSSAASWHCGLCTSIAKILRHKSRQRRCKLSLKSRQRSGNLKEKITT